MRTSITSCISSIQACLRLATAWENVKKKSPETFQLTNEENIQILSHLIILKFFILTIMNCEAGVFKKIDLKIVFDQTWWKRLNYLFYPLNRSNTTKLLSCKEAFKELQPKNMGNHHWHAVLGSYLIDMLYPSGFSDFWQLFQIYNFLWLFLF